MGVNAPIEAHVVNFVWPQHVSQYIKENLIEFINHDKESSVKDNALNH
jgi:hypothetical protein